MRKKSASSRFLSVAFLICVFLSQTSQAFQVQKIDDEKFARIVKKVQAKLNESHASAKFPGATVGFVLPDGRFASVSSGVSDLEMKTPLKPTDKMLAGSIGKTFVAATALQLVGEGKLNLDAKIERWFENEKWFARLPNAKDITLRMLLNHTSGIPNHVDDENFLEVLFKNSDKDIRYEELIAYILGKKPLSAAGKSFNYADTNYILIGMIVEKATGKTLYDEITERILKPLKLSQTFPSNKNILPQVANGYFQNKPIIVNGKFTVNPQWEWAGGGFASTAGDLARWAQALYAGDVLQKNLLEEMLKGVKTSEGTEYGLGVEITKGKFGKTYGHDGEFPGYLSDARYFTEQKIAVAVQVNADENPQTNKFIASAVDDFAQIIIGELFNQNLMGAEKIEIQKTAEDWLKLVDAGKFAESWEGISVELKTKYTKENWQSVLQNFVKKIGKFKLRKIKSIVSTDSETIAIDFESSFAKLPSATETIILKREKDGKRRVASYSIK
jgi:D-alanyl-D-alanine carboxypeptidase